MLSRAEKKLIEKGVTVSRSKMYKQDKIWSRYSNDKVDIGEQLARVIRTLSKEFALNKDLRALSIGSSDEPQFRILETAFRGGLYLFDLEQAALDLVTERVIRQNTDHVTTILDDYNKVFTSPARTDSFLKNRLGGGRVNLITMHHSLYYCQEEKWHVIMENLYRKILAPKGAMHLVLMSAGCTDRDSTTWLYDHFAGKFFGHKNDQDLIKFKKELGKNPVFSKAQILSRTNRVKFFVDDFEKFMAVVWMILLYPNVHRYTRPQREEIALYVYENFWKRKRPLIQVQDHLAIYKGLTIKGLV
ncbi:MAG: class I SAM-dependent methyltransferase [Candidatus Omnitrophica bacterium]|nr:class I SAM-dependent methyltransferase [Candidatus Omnitrophota bacterium]